MTREDLTSEQSLADSHALLPAALTGNAQALGLLSQRLRPYLKEVVLRLLARELPGADNDHSDLVQQTLLRAVEGIAGFRGQTLNEWKGWLAAIARNETLAAIRHEKAQRRDRCRTGPLDLVSALSDSIDSPSKAMQLEELRQRLEQALNRLTPDQRQLLHWRQEDQLSHAEIADRLSIQIDAARQRCKAAMDALRKIWKTM
jgi:RNA polymerase sigma factor (sigma-70 family)